MRPYTLSSSSLNHTKVRNTAGEHLGEVKDFMVDLNTGRIAYAVLSFGGFLGIGDKLFAIPWAAMKVNTEDEVFVLDVDKKRLEKAPGFDENNWPSSADARFLDTIYAFYRTEPYWQS
ncbi:MAG: PRC-barrel domain-containing protein [Rhodothermales bacterium]